MRDYATVEQLLVLANIEGMDAEFIYIGLEQGERLKHLNQIAIHQIQTLAFPLARRTSHESGMQHREYPQVKID